MENKELKFGDEVAIICNTDANNIDYGKFIAYSINKQKCLVSTEGGARLYLANCENVFPNENGLISEQIKLAREFYEKELSPKLANDPA